MESSNNKFNFDLLSGVLLLGGSVAAILTKQVVSAVIPVSLAVGLEIFNRQQELVKVQTQTQQQLLTNNETLQENFKTQQSSITQINDTLKAELQRQQAKITTIEEEIASTLKLSEQKQQRELVTASQKIEQQIGEIKESLLVLSLQAEKHHQEQDRIRNSVLNLSLQMQKIDQEQDGIRAVVNEFHKIEEPLQQLKAQPGSAEFYCESGLKYQGLNDWNSAIEYYTQAISLKPEYAEAYHNRGIVYVKLNNRKRAIEDLRQAAKIYFEQNNLEQYQQARTFYKELYNPTPSSPENLITLEGKKPVSSGSIDADQLFAP